MNCAECRDNLIAQAEGLLDREETIRCQAHLQSCADCRAEYEAIASLQQRLVARGQASAGVNVAHPVMRRVLGESQKLTRSIIMRTLFKYRWGFGLGTAMLAAGVVLVSLLGAPKTHAAAIEVMTRGAQAVARLTSIHLRGQLRTLPADNFSYIGADCPFYTIELWKQFAPDSKWRVEKPERVVVMDGASTVMFVKSGQVGVRIPHRANSAFDTDWLQRIANLSNAITNEIKNALNRKWDISLEEKTGADGKPKSVVTILAKPGVPDNDYLKNVFYDIADTRRVYRFDQQSELLESVQIYLVQGSSETEIFDLNQIEYNQPFSPETWKLDLPADINWAQLPENVPVLPDNQKYASMTAEQAARAFLEACSRDDWGEAGKFMSPMNNNLKQAYGGLEIVNIGDSFTSKAYRGRFVPYEVKLRAMEFTVRVSNDNPAHRYVMTAICDTNLQPQQELNWTNPPAILPNNEVYAALSPADAVKACMNAWASFNWDELRKFDPGYDVEDEIAKFEMARKNGVDANKVFPRVEVGEAFWSPEHSAWFVKCRAVQDKKWNMALRKDNPAGRWQVDGGI